MKTFELSKKIHSNGKRKFKIILHEIYPDSVIDSAECLGTKYNLNGITWIREFCEKALPSIKGMPLRCEFLDEERTELCGHGETGVVDGLPIFENSVVIGTFEDGYIEDIVTEDNRTITACIGVGYIFGDTYHNLCEKIDNDMKNNLFPSGSVEIIRCQDNAGIEYLGGCAGKEGRIPTEFLYSAYALLGVAPADREAKLIELNKKINENKEDKVSMNELEIKALIEKTVEEVSSRTAEINQCKDECDKKVNEANEKVANAECEKNEIIANSEKIQEALDACIKERDEAWEKIDKLHDEMKELREALAKALAKERIGELNSAISAFTEDEKAYAQTEIDAFNADPVSSEINSVVNKIYEGIGIKAKKEAEIVASEQNSANTTVEDIFSEVSIDAPDTEDINIF